MPIPTMDELTLLHSTMCHAVADTRRIQILYALADQPTYVSALADLLETPQPTISRHLAVLRERGLVLAERSGAQVIYSVADRRIIEVLDTMRDMLRATLDRKTSVLREDSGSVP